MPIPEVRRVRVLPRDPIRGSYREPAAQLQSDQPRYSRAAYATVPADPPIMTCLLS
jgi:hypothetical protein